MLEVSLFAVLYLLGCTLAADLMDDNAEELGFYHHSIMPLCVVFWPVLAIISIVHRCLQRAGKS